MPIKNEILQNLEAKSEENVEQKPTKWKEFKTKHRTTAKIIKVTKGVVAAAGGALYINPIAQMSALVTATVAGGVSVVSDRSEEQLETDMITAASAGAVGGIVNAVILLVCIPVGAVGGAITFGIDAAKKFDEKQRRQIEVDNDKFADKKTAINNIDSQIEVKIESKKIASL
ncbi:hypothetical protein [Spiroplasma endosymbiont of Dasysyrphus albostriatus]|uniref:hypothetical protein n=1 Tax=Spiroplasma endosymbiont of Dasysyrphus albostriatus TaxID=3066299 RepID=UPI0030CCB154